MFGIIQTKILSCFNIRNKMDSFQEVTNLWFGQGSLSFRAKDKFYRQIVMYSIPSGYEITKRAHDDFPRPLPVD